MLCIYKCLKVCPLYTDCDTFYITSGTCKYNMLTLKYPAMHVLPNDKGKNYVKA